MKCIVSVPRWWNQQHSVFVTDLCHSLYGDKHILRHNVTDETEEKHSGSLTPWCRGEGRARPIPFAPPTIDAKWTMRISVASHWIILLSALSFSSKCRGGMKPDEERQAGFNAGGYTEEDGGRSLLWWDRKLILLTSFFVRSGEDAENFNGAFNARETQKNAMYRWQGVLKLSAGYKRCKLSFYVRISNVVIGMELSVSVFL